MKSLYPAPETSFSGDAVDTEAVWITRLTVLDSAHCLRIARTASTAASAVLLYCPRPSRQGDYHRIDEIKGDNMDSARFSSLGEMDTNLGAGGFEAEGSGDEEDELAPGDCRRESGCVEEVGIEQSQPLRRAGDEPPQQPRFLLITCGQQSIPNPSILITWSNRRFDSADRTCAPVFRRAAWTV
jgi:hypothetical protein